MGDNLCISDSGLIDFTPQCALLGPINFSLLFTSRYINRHSTFIFSFL